MRSYEIYKPIIDNMLHLSLTHVSKEDMNIMESAVFNGISGIEIHKLKNGFLMELPETMDSLDQAYENISRGLYTIIVTAMNIDVQYLMFSTDGHEIDILTKYI